MGVNVSPFSIAALFRLPSGSPNPHQTQGGPSCRPGPTWLERLFTSAILAEPISFVMSQEMPRNIKTLASLQVSLGLTAWTDLALRPAGRVNGRKGPWAALIAVSFLGPALYFTRGVHRSGTARHCVVAPVRAFPDA